MPVRFTSLILLIALFVGGCAPAPTPTLTPVPTETATPPPPPTLPPTPTSPPPTIARTALPTLTPTGEAAAPPTPYATRQQVEEGVAPPLDITLPEGWQYGYGVLPIRDALTGGVPVAIYTGPLPDLPEATGSVVILWNFPSISASATPDLWADGLRFLRGALLDPSCNIGTDLTRSFSVGPHDAAVGTYFQAVGCQGEADTAGWFAGVQEQGGNYVFYAYVEPIAQYNAAIPTLQAILESVVFHNLAAAP